MVIDSKTIKLFQNLMTTMQVSIQLVLLQSVKMEYINLNYRKTNTLKDIKVINGGQNYQNRQLFVNPTGINTNNHTLIL